MDAGLGMLYWDWVLPQLTFLCPCFCAVARRQEEVSLGEGP